MTVRLDLKEGIKADMHSWFYESASDVYNKREKYYDKFADIRPLSEIKGGYWKGTSAIGARELEDRTSLGKYSEDLPQEGYTVYATIRDKALKIKCPRELKRDWHRTSDWLKEYVKKNWVDAVENTKEILVADMYNKGGFTSGADIFDNNESDLNLTTYASPKLCYDGKEFLNKDGSDRPMKFQTTGTYFNATAITTGDDSAGVTQDNAKDMLNLMKAINNVQDNGKPFDNSSNISVGCNPGLEFAWQVVNGSTKNPDNASNANNPIKGAFKSIYPNPWFSTTTFSVIFREGIAGVRAWFSEPKFDFWEEYDPETYWAAVVLDYAIAVVNWRPVVSNNAPVS